MDRKTLAGTLVAVLVFSLAACGGDQEAPPAPTSAASDAAAQGPVDGEVVIFSYEDTLEDFIQQPFREANPDLEVTGAPFGNAGQTVTKLRGGSR